MRILISCILLCSLIGACKQPATDQPPKATPQLTGEVSQAEVDKHLQFLSKADQQFAATPFGHQNLLQIILREKLIATDAKALGLDQQADYQKALADKRAQLDEIFATAAADLLERQWYDYQTQHGALAVSDEEINAYYKKYPYEMTVKQIILDNAQTADAVLRTLKRAPGKWKDMSRQYSIAPEALRNSTFMPGEFLPEIEVIAATSAAGSVQGFIKTPQGFHIIMKTGEKRLSKKDAEPRIRAVLENQKLDEILQQLQTKYEVIIHE